MLELLYIFAGIVAIIGLFLLVEKPHFVAVLVVFLNLYRYNLNIPGPLDLRGLLTLVLFIRIFFDKKNINLIKGSLLKDKYFWLLVIFAFINFAVSYYYSPIFKISFKLFAINIVSLVLGFYIFSSKNGFYIFLFGFILSGITATFDIMYSRIFIGELHVYRVLDVLKGSPTSFNHNFFGILIGISLLFLVSTLIKKKMNSFINYSFIFLFSFGILFSTSRSAIISVIVTLLLVFIFENVKIFSIKKVILGTIIFGVLGIFLYIGYSSFSHSNTSNTKLITKMTDRLIEIPEKLFGEEKKEFDPLSGKLIKSTISWRFEKWGRDLQKTSERDFVQQIWGTGQGSYEKFGHVRYMAGSGDRQVYAAHNSFINVLVERGAISLFLLFVIIIGMSIKSLKQSNGYDNSIIYIIISLSLVAHSLIVQDSGFLLYGAVIASYYFEDDDYEDEESEEEYDNLDEEPQKMLGEL